MNTTAPFYLTRPLRATALSSPVGSGKSFAASRYLASAEQAHQNFIYVAPTIALVEQVRTDLCNAAAAAGAFTRNVSLIHSENRRERADEDSDDDVPTSTREAALRAINGAEEGDGLVVVLTTGSLLAIISSIRNPERFGLLMDEAFKPLRVDSFALGDDPRAGWTYFREVFDIDLDNGHRIVPAEGQRERVEAIAAGRFGKVGGKYAGLKKLAELVGNPATRCELVLSEPIEALMRGEKPKVKKSTGKDKSKDAEVMLHYAGYVSPEPFTHYREVLLLSALFEQSVLHALWSRALGVTFSDHPSFPKELQRDVHAEQGRFLAVGYLLHGDDNASMENLMRNHRTGLKAETRKGHRVLDHLVQSAVSYFGDRKFLLQCNAKRGYDRHDPRPSSSAEWIPAFAYGLNAYQEVDNVAALCIINPPPIEWTWVKDRTGMTDAEVARAYRIPATYQALGRCSIRRRDQTTDPKTLICVGKKEADFILRLFPGSRDLGQLGDLPSLRMLETSLRPRKKTKTEMMADLITEYLSELGEEVDSISSQALREAIRCRKVLLSPQEGEPAPLDVSRDTWHVAVTFACGPGSGWMRQDKRLVRVTWDMLMQQAGHPAEASM